MRRVVAWPGHAWIALPARFYLGLVFVLACLHKIAHPEIFALDVATYDILPLPLVNLMAITLPWIELVAGVFLIVGFRTRGAALAIFGMMVMFIIAIVVALARGIDMSCGCFASQAAVEDDPISWITIFRDLGWLVLAGYVVLFDHAPLGMDRLLRKRTAHA
ncbi:MauE/DoxX family redox-associated membrane protein [Myxococcota bacterium]